MKIKTWFVFILGMCFAACSPAISDKTALSTAVSSPINITHLNKEQKEYQIDGFSQNYYGVAHIESEKDFCKQGWIEVRDKKTDEELIKISSTRMCFEFHEKKITANTLDLPYGEQSLIIYNDFNFDGVKDFAIQDDKGSCYGGLSFSIFLFQKEKFAFNSDFTQLAQDPYCGMFLANPKEQKLYAMTKSGCCLHQYSEYVIQNNVPVTQKIITSEWDDPYELITTQEWIEGRLVETMERKAVLQTP